MVPGGMHLARSKAGQIKFYESHGFGLVKKTDGAENEERVPDALYQRIKR